MSYTKHTWADGELVTAAKMNNIENGIEEASSGGGVLVVHNANGTLDKTWAEIDAADVAVIVSNGSAGGVTLHMREFVMGTVDEDGVYSVDATGIGHTTYETDSADGYPVKSSLQAGH